jgi:hypothetical protein
MAIEMVRKSIPNMLEAQDYKRKCDNIRIGFNGALW